MTWQPVIGVDGSLYHQYFFCVHENSDLADHESCFKKHLLLEFLDDLGVIEQYVRDHSNSFNVVYEIVLKVK